MARKLTFEKNGFTLIELLVGLAILGAVLLPCLSFVAYRLHKEQDNDEYRKALQICNSVMEQTLQMKEPDITDQTVDNKFLVKTEVFRLENINSDQYDLKEIRISVLRIKDGLVLIHLSALQ